MSDFQKLLGELGTLSADTLAKALPADDGKGDEKIQAAAEGGGESPAKKPGDEGYVEPEGGDKPMAKSFQVTLADGTVVDAEDGTELVKSLVGRLDETESSMAKALELTIGMLKAQGTALEQQTALVKSLNDKVAALSGEGRGRKTILSVIEKQAPTELAKSEPTGMSGVEFMLKSNAAFDAGKITGRELTVIDVSLREGVAIDSGLIAKIVG